MAEALDGITVIELVHKGPGAFVTMMLADMGAEVIKVEAPPRAGAVESGGSPPKGDRRAQAAKTVNRGKRSIGLDLKHPDGQAVIHKLAARAAVVVEGFRPGVAKRLGADYQELKRINPSLVYCSLSGYGQDGPYRDLPGHDINYLGFAGILGLVGQRGGQPLVPPNLIADYGGAAMHAVAGIMMALFVRQRTGVGQLVDIAYLDCALALMSATRYVHDYVRFGMESSRGIGALSGNFPFYGVYETKDAKFLCLGCLELPLWRNFCEAIGKPDFVDAGLKPSDFQGIESERQVACRRELESIFRSRDRDEWFGLLTAAGVAVGKVYEIAEVFHDPQLIHRNMILRRQDPVLGDVLHIGIPIKLSETPGSVKINSPWRGQHTDEILRDIGYAEKEISSLRAAGIA